MSDFFIFLAWFYVHCHCTDVDYCFTDARYCCIDLHVCCKNVHHHCTDIHYSCTDVNYSCTDVHYGCTDVVYPYTDVHYHLLNFIKIHYQIYKNFSLLLMLILYLAFPKYCKNQIFKLSSVNWNC